MTRRRDFLAFTASAVTAATVLPAVGKSAPIDVVSQEPAVAGELLPSAGKYPDAELIAICTELQALSQETKSLGLPDWPGRTAAINVNCSRWEVLTVRAAGMPATTMDGLRAKARAVRRYLEEFGLDVAYSSDEGEDLLLRSLARDLFGGDYVYVAEEEA